ncbi:hypothetical protein UlMin_014452 [Ulmus minor]
MKVHQRNHIYTETSPYYLASQNTTMKFHALHELPTGKNPQPNSYKKHILLFFYFLLLTSILLWLRNSSPSSFQSPQKDRSSLKSVDLGKKCNLFNGTWVPFPNEPYYNNETCGWIIDQQNCLKFGRPDLEFLKWRWKPYDCDLPFFDAAQFLELVKGKSLAFLGDSVGRNQMLSLLCLLSSVTYPEDDSHIYYSDTTYFKRFIYKDYNFTLGTLWAPFLVKAKESDPNGYSANSRMNLYLDEPEETWAAQVEMFDYVIVSAGQWFFRPSMLHEKGRLIGCSNCKEENITDLTTYYAYGRAFRTLFRTLLRLENYKGVTILRTFSPSHFENGVWNAGGNCPRTRPFAKGEVSPDQYILDMHSTQTEEFRAAEEIGKKMGLKFSMIDTTEAMFMRPDAHPNYNGHSPRSNTSIADCVHWCLPGPIDTWNEMLLHILRTGQRPQNGTQ